MTAHLPTLPSPLLRSLTRVGCFSFSFVRILKPVAWVRSYDRGRERFGLSGFCVSTHRKFACLRYGKDGSMATFDDYGIFVWLSAASSCFSPAFSLVAWVSLEEGGDLLSTVYLIFFKVLPVPSSLVYLFLLSVFSFVLTEYILPMYYTLRASPFTSPLPSISPAHIISPVSNQFVDFFFLSLLPCARLPSSHTHA